MTIVKIVVNNCCAVVQWFFKSVLVILYCFLVDMTFSLVLFLLKIGFQSLAKNSRWQIVDNYWSLTNATQCKPPVSVAISKSALEWTVEFFNVIFFDDMPRSRSQSSLWSWRFCLTWSCLNCLGSTTSKTIRFYEGESQVRYFILCRLQMIYIN